jgi:nitrogen regulatory protein P-II 1
MEMTLIHYNRGPRLVKFPILAVSPPARYGTGHPAPGAPTLKLVVAIIQPTKLKAVQEALTQVGVERLTICDAQGYGRQRGQLAMYRGLEYKTQLLRKVAIEIAVNDDFLDRTIETIEAVARTGQEGSIGDGKIFVLPIVETYRIGELVRGPEAV